MNSKGIEPRVGMLFSYSGDKRYLHDVETFSVVPVYSPYEYDKEFIGKVVGWAAECMWRNGDYEIIWTPPTYAERAMFREAAEEFRSMASGGPSSHGIYRMYADPKDACGGLDPMCATCVGNWEGPAELFAQIADSLALDGADCDNMPDGYV
jgi:hypothetical protein